MGCGFSVDVQNSVKTQISMLESSLSLAEKKVADLINAQPALVVDSNVSETAELSGVSEATIVRFCKHLGFSGFYQMKLQLSHDIGHQQHGAINAAQGSSMQKRLLHIANRVQSISQQLDLKDVKCCAEAISGCSTVYVIGSGQSRVLASDITFRLASRGFRAIGGGDYKVEISNLLNSLPNDILICISRSGETRRVIQAAELARERGMTVIALTAAEKSPLHSIASVTLSTGSYPEDDPDSNIYLAVLLDAIFTYVRQKPEDAKHFEYIVSESRI